MNVQIGFAATWETVVSHAGPLDDRRLKATWYRLEAAWSVMWSPNVPFWDFEEKYVGQRRSCSGVASAAVGFLLRYLTMSSALCGWTSEFLYSLKQYRFAQSWKVRVFYSKSLKSPWSFYNIESEKSQQSCIVKNIEFFCFNFAK